MMMKKVSAGLLAGLLLILICSTTAFAAGVTLTLGEEAAIRVIVSEYQGPIIRMNG